MIILSAGEIIDRVLMVDRVGGKMNEVARVIAEKARTEKMARLCIGHEFAKAKIVSGQMQLADVSAFSGSHGNLVSRPLGGFRTLTRKGEFRIGEDHLQV